MQDIHHTQHSQQPDSFATEGTRRVTGVAKESGSNALKHTPNPEVSPNPQRRKFSKAYKLRILEQWDQCTQSGEKAALLRREGLYSQNIANWIKLRKNGKLKENTQPINTTAFSAAEKQKLMRLELENEKLKADLTRAEKILDIQKKVAELLNLQEVQETNLK